MENIYSNENKTINDKEEEFRKYLKSAEEGNGDAQFYLGKCYMQGIGTTKDEENAFQWYLRSAEGGNSYGQQKLGYFYQNGIGTTKDEKKAFQWYLKSAEGGNHMGQNNLGHCYGKGIGTTKDEEKAFKWYLKSAEGGNHLGQSNIGWCYREGIGATKDEEKAFQWYLRSAEGGNSHGQQKLGYLYQNGIGTTKDEEKAFHWYLKSAKEGNHSGQCNLGWCYEKGIGTTKDEEKAFQWYRKSAEGGNHAGQNNLGCCYEKRIGTTKDEEKAFQWYLKSAEGGNLLGQCNLGWCYEKGIGTTKDEEKAFQWYRKSAEGGNHAGQNNLGCCYEKRIGTTKDEEKAFQWYLKSAEGGNLLGQCNLGWCYEKGIGTTKDEEKAFQWYRKSAEGGNHAGQNNLGCCYEKRIGTTKDEEKAFQWYLRAAEGGNLLGQNNLGCCYEKEIGTTKDEEKAFQWYLKSAEGGEPLGQNNLGWCYELGIGTTKDEEKAFQWYLKSAEGGEKYGQSSIEYFHRNEISYVKKNKNKLENKCINCENLNQQNNTCSDSKLIEIPKWTSDYSKLKNVKYLAEGGFGSIWKAEWIDVPEEVFEFYKSNQVVLKKLKNSQEISSEFLKELTANFQCRDKYVLPILGITQDSMTKEYAIVLRYMKNGNLRDFLNQNKSLPWIERIWLLNSFIRGLKVIHSKGFVHRDLHPGNLMITEAHSNSKYKFIRLGDLGLCRLANETISSGTYGVLPFIAPELTANFQCRDKYVLPILGITQDSMTKEYAIVLRYMKNGNLRDFLNQNKSLPWIERIWLLNSFIRGLKVIHSKGFVHRDLHPGNLMITEAHSNSKYKFIRLGDLGLCRLANETISSGTYGVLPFIAPEVFDKNLCTQASDIYSVGMIMWIISTGKKPFANRAYNAELVIDIFNGLRPKINKSTPQCYKELMEKCWHKDPSERPSAEMIYDISERWIDDLLYDEDEKTEDSLMFLNADQNIQDENIEEDLSTTHPEAYLTSNLLPTSVNYININNLNFDGRRRRFPLNLSEGRNLEPKERFKLLKEQAKKNALVGNIDAMNNIFITEEEFRQYLKLVDAQFDLGNYYIQGIRTTKDEEKAFPWNLKSSEGGIHLGQNNLGDEEKAFQWYLKSAK
ncbi:hypothetical protein Glove_421g2 [Diversispora epigaea]|uniref:Protein kinase domain-containing protein n=1 Tax=Diversispora epigaea TaxID=1348612 RepID=A0A397GVD7_9GLOM|nr:hypothetical protein Glove_421g2 [Diversispora epigaea]